MERRAQINLSLLVCLSASLHLLLVWMLVIPSMEGLKFADPFAKKNSGGAPSRDIIMNINQDDRVIETVNTLLSDKSSTARGHLTKERGDTFLNNSLDFRMPKAQLRGGGNTGAANSSGSSTLPQTNGSIVQSSSASDEESPESITIVPLNKSLLGGGSEAEESEWMKIPDKMGINRKNALYLSNDGVFSYDTKKYADFKYFSDMKAKIGSHWFPPTMANNYLLEDANKYGFYTPGYTRTHLIPSQEVPLYFVMNRNGDVIDIKVMGGNGSQVIVDSCVDAIRNSKSFGPVPEDMKGSRIVIPFIFAYIVMD